jgi:hypothetical protein
MEWVRPSRRDEPRNLAPLDNPRLQQAVVRGRGEAVPAGAEVIGERAEGGEELLRVGR